ncbi:unnamed protein product [Eruca vesicaria subsp. sativa]|uniref:Peptidase S54 rhomboid domain-containing protein n=1 Tax=Eruca vesicaria subsp. sativa TaxID=29727 RepID=A0ABC8JN85_ERUVS|nr:unnamed protein product [Eruca vesicaria subsp. sativa]CAH8334854.1 unnamed protein product [Eruca vesicaria subsp. sativa]
MHAIFSRKFVVGVGSSSSMMKKKKPAFPYTSHLLPSEIHGFFASTLRNNTHLKLKPGSTLLESRAGFLDPQLPPKPWVFTGFQKRGWKSWFNGGNGVVFGLIIANVAVFTMWKNSDKTWMAKNFVLSSYTFMSGRIHTLITSGFSNVGTSQLIVNMFGLYYFGTRIARTLGPVYLLKLYFAGSLAGSFLFISLHGVMAILKVTIIVSLLSNHARYIHREGPERSVYAIALLDLCLYPRVTTYFEFICRVPLMLGEQKSITGGSIHAVGGAMVAAIAWKQIKKGRFNY